MPVGRLSSPDDFDGWREAARTLALADVAAEHIVWQIVGEAGDLFGSPAATSDAAVHPTPFAVSRAFVALARTALCHSDPERFALLYRLLLRVREQPAILSDQADPLVRRIERLARVVRRDIHKMHAFVRFREIAEEDGAARFVAWFEPDHHIVRLAAGFFVDRFATMRWSILTPELSLHWDNGRLREGPGATRADAPSGDPVETTWKRYYAAIFNPARLKMQAMLKEMPRKYWANMPETALIGNLVAHARNREIAMVDRSREQVHASGPDSRSPEAQWATLRTQAAECTRCDLHRCATQTVFGEGPIDGRLMFVGEQPGDQEDLAGRAFIGPAGQLFDRALAEAGVERRSAYVTNAVKHFKYEQRGKRRLHARPNTGEIKACRWWLDQERALIRPQLAVALGTTAAHALLGKATSITSVRGTPQVALDGGEAWVTVHPSFLLRVRNDREAEYDRFVEDLRRIGERLRTLTAN
jgi:DNA polymerase